MIDLRQIRISLFVAAFAMPLIGYGQAAKTEAPQTGIVDHIKEAGHHEVMAPDDILKLLEFNKASGTATPAEEKRGTAMRTVYRVQVFSDNNGERSRSEGEKKRRAVQSRFPDYPCSLGWHTPYWKVKVGIFTTQAEASEAAAKIKRAFPSYAKEIHVIRDRMKINK